MGKVMSPAVVQRAIHTYCPIELTCAAGCCKTVAVAARNKIRPFIMRTLFNKLQLITPLNCSFMHATEVQF